MITNFDNSLFGNKHRLIDESALRIQAGKNFNSAYNRGKIQHLLAMILGKDNQLKTLSGQPLNSQRRTGHIVSVPIQQIKGSLGRSHDFDAKFNPLDEGCRTRWISLLTAIWKGIPIPAVELVRSGDAYYVVDGHHRISVLKFLGQDMVDARILN
jgi:hypothetical protein